MADPYDYDADDDFDSMDDNDWTEPCPNCGEMIFEDSPRCPVCGEYVIHRQLAAREEEHEDTAGERHAKPHDRDSCEASAPAKAGERIR